MTIQDYRAIGDVLAKNNATPEIIDAMCDLFLKDNPKFDKKIFMRFIKGTGWTQFSYLHDQKYI